MLLGDALVVLGVVFTMTQLEDPVALRARIAEEYAKNANSNTTTTMATATRVTRATTATAITTATPRPIKMVTYKYSSTDTAAQVADMVYTATSASAVATPSANTDSCPLNKGYFPLEKLPDADVCSSKFRDSSLHGVFDKAGDTCPIPIGANGERMYHWLPKGKSLNERRAQDKDVGLNPDTWMPWTHRPVCAEKGKYCVFSTASIPGLPLGSTPEIVMHESTPTLTDSVRSKIDSYVSLIKDYSGGDEKSGHATAIDNVNTTLLTPEKNTVYNSKWESLLGKYTDKEALFQGVSILTTPEMAASDLHPSNFELQPEALARYDHFAKLPPAFKIQKIPDLPDVPLEVSVEDVLKQKADKDYRDELRQNPNDENSSVRDEEHNKDDKVAESHTFLDSDDDNDDDDGVEGDDFGDIVIDSGEDESANAEDAEVQDSAKKEFTPEVQDMINRRDRAMKPAKKTPVELTSSKGWGAVANRDIHAGEPVIMERPAIVAHDALIALGDDDMAVHGSHLTMDEDDHGLALESVENRAHLWKTMVDNLPPATSARVRSLNVLPKYRADFQERPAGLDTMNQTSNEYIDADHEFRNAASQLSFEEKVFDSNAFAMSINGYSMKGLFPRISILNHGCQPNTVATWSEAPMAMIVYANQDIKKGEELTMNYLNDDLTLKARTVLNAHRFGFKCQCPLCREQRRSTNARQQSDRRRDLLKFELPTIVQSAVAIGRFDLALQAYLVTRNTLTAEGLRQPGTVWESDIGLFRGLEGADASVSVPVADAFGPRGVNVALGELLAQQGKFEEALPYLRAALVEIAWRSAGYQTQEEQQEQEALFVLIEAVETQISRQDVAKGGDGVTVLTAAKTSTKDVLEPTLNADQIAFLLNKIIDDMEEQEFLKASGRDMDTYGEGVEEDGENEE
ncbi:set domain containing protein [Ophiostoma piceae UAMH 11346]|uniref:Set domain containing protein n=1 Tax=Ophiostoma piceae (strain UAMH 11346) TaxID=1262450 RepID=S3C1H6_OPHP1|nr:set domain containing protein [Ophiostoma piceae UAMH 11346]